MFDAPRECGEVVKEALGATFAVGDDAHKVVVDVVRASSSGDVAAANEPGKDLWLDLVLARLISGFVAHRMFGWCLGLRSFVDEFVDDLSAPAVCRFERVEAVPCLLPLASVRPVESGPGLFLQRLRPVGVGDGPVSLLFGPCGGSGGGEDELAKQSHETVGGRSTGGGPLHHLVVRVLLRADGTAGDEHGGHDGVAGSTCTIEGARLPRRAGKRLHAKEDWCPAQVSVLLTRRELLVMQLQSFEGLERDAVGEAQVKVGGRSRVEFERVDGGRGVAARVV